MEKMFNPVMNKEDALGTEQVALYNHNGVYWAEFRETRGSESKAKENLYLVRFDENGIHEVMKRGVRKHIDSYLRNHGKEFKCVWTRYTKIINNSAESKEYDSEQLLGIPEPFW